MWSNTVCIMIITNVVCYRTRVEVEFIMLTGTGTVMHYGTKGHNSLQHIIIGLYNLLKYHTKWMSVVLCRVSCFLFMTKILSSNQHKTLNSLWEDCSYMKFYTVKVLRFGCRPSKNKYLTVTSVYVDSQNSHWTFSHKFLHINNTDAILTEQTTRSITDHWPPACMH